VHITSDDLTDALREHGMRVTEPRRAICEVLARSHDEHLDAPTIHARVAAEVDTAVDQSTVYRTLDALEEIGLLTHTHLGHRPAAYHLSEEERHQHFVCDVCGKTVAVPGTAIDDWAADIRARTGFVVDPGHFALSGRCADCAARADDDAPRPIGQ
jgi:Fur family ferric uptake transcriptional regulator